VDDRRERLAPPPRSERLRLVRCPVDGDGHDAVLVDGEHRVREHDRNLHRFAVPALGAVGSAGVGGAPVAGAAHQEPSGWFGIADERSRIRGTCAFTSPVMRLVVSNAVSSAGWSWCWTT